LHIVAGFYKQVQLCMHPSPCPFKPHSVFPTSHGMVTENARDQKSWSRYCKDVLDCNTNVRWAMI